MKKIFIVCFMLVVCFLFVGNIDAIMMEDVGSPDTLIGVSYLPNSGDETELTWINDTLGDEYFITEKYDVLQYTWVEVENEPGVVASNLLGTPEYFFIKIGVGGLPNASIEGEIEGEKDSTIFDHYLYANVGDLNWGVISFKDWGYPNISICNIGRISHVGEVGAAPVPEPSTMLLLGFGLIGLGTISRVKLLKKG